MSTIRKFLDLSTCNLPQHIMNELNSFEGVTAYEDDYGAWMWVPTDIDQHLADYYHVPTEIEKIWHYARARGCDYVRFDRDGEVNTELDFWEW